MNGVLITEAFFMAAVSLLQLLDRIVCGHHTHGIMYATAGTQHLKEAPSPPIQCAHGRMTFGRQLEAVQQGAGKRLSSLARIWTRVPEVRIQGIGDLPHHRHADDRAT